MTGDIWPRVNAEICKAWGLNPNEVRTVTITFSASSKPQATVIMALNEKVMEIVMQLEPAMDIRD